jgi:hypothetical protein
MTDEKPTLQEQLNHALELHGIDPSNAYISERDIGNGPQYAVELYDSEKTSNQLFESYWYSRDEIEAYLTALKNLHTIQRKQSRE